MNEPEFSVRVTTQRPSVCAIGYVMLFLTLVILASQTVVLAIHQWRPNWSLIPSAVISSAGLVWVALAFLLIFTLRFKLLPVPQATAARVQRIALRAAGLLIAGKFVLFEIGKLRHNVEMENFFRTSGFPAGLHYSVVALELIGAVGVLLPVRRIRTVAAVALLAIMGAAIATHLNNGDPLSDSCDALFQALYLFALLGLSHPKFRMLPFSAHPLH